MNRRFTLLLSFAVGYLAGGCERTLPSDLPTLTGRTMGTGYTVRVAALPEGYSESELQAEVDRVLERVNDQMSTYRVDSELSRFNARRGTDWFDVSADTARVVVAALETSALTEGAFDATIGPLVNIWSFGADPREREVPTDDALDAVRSKTGYSSLEVRDRPPALRKARPEIEVDLSAIAKGFGVDRVAGRLGELGVSGYMVEVGGEIRTFGAKPGGAAWVIGIERPVFGRRDLHRAIELGNRSLATSGDYRNYFEEDGVRYSHMINPRTGRPITHRLASVSVVADECMRADAWATALMVLGPDAGYELAVANGLAALFLTRDGEAFTERATPSFEASFGE